MNEIHKIELLQRNFRADLYREMESGYAHGQDEIVYFYYVQFYDDYKHYGTKENCLRLFNGEIGFEEFHGIKQENKIEVLENVK